MTRAEKYLKEHPDVSPGRGVPLVARDGMYALVLCAQEEGFDVECNWPLRTCKDCWNEEAE